MVPRRGVEPRLTVSKAAVLPLDDLGARGAAIKRTQNQNPHVFSGRRKGQCLQDLKGPWRLIKTEAGLERTRLHDLRHTFASVGASAHLSLPIIGKLLGHTQAATTARYAHLADDPLRLANETIGDAISKALVAGSGESRF